MGQFNVPPDLANQINDLKTRVRTLETISRWTTAGTKIIPAAESTSSTTYTTLGTADEVPVSLAHGGLVAVFYQATWKESVLGAARAAIYVGANQLKVASTAGAGGAPAPQSAATGGNPVAGNNSPLCSSPIGLIGGLAANYPGDVGTGQAIAYAGTGLNGGGSFEVNGSVRTLPNDSALGGACYIFADAGTYTIGVRFMCSSGSVTATNRRLCVEVQPF